MKFNGRRAVKRETIKQIIFIVSVIILIQVPLTCQANMLTNGHFEDGNLSSWEVTWNESNLNPVLLRLTNRG